MIKQFAIRFNCVAKIGCYTQLMYCIFLCLWSPNKMSHAGHICCPHDTCSSRAAVVSEEYHAVSVYQVLWSEPNISSEHCPLTTVTQVEQCWPVTGEYLIWLHAPTSPDSPASAVLIKPKYWRGSGWGAWVSGESLTRCDHCLVKFRELHNSQLTPTTTNHQN